MSATTAKPTLTRESIGAALSRARADLKATHRAMPAAERTLAEAYAAGTTLATDPTGALRDRALRLEATISGLEQLAARAEYFELRGIVDSWNSERPKCEKEVADALDRARVAMTEPGRTRYERSSSGDVHSIDVAQQKLREGDERAHKADFRMRDITSECPAAFADLDAGG